jgi:hypothetical protein
MDITSHYRKNIRAFYAWIGSTLLLGAGSVVGELLIDGGSPNERVAGAAFAMLSWIPWILVVIRMLRHGDEFALRVQLVALSCAFLGIMIVLAALDWLTRAAFIEPPPYAFLWPLGLAFWFAGMLMANHHYQRDS